MTAALIPDPYTHALASAAAAWSNVPLDLWLHADNHDQRIRETRNAVLAILSRRTRTDWLSATAGLPRFWCPTTAAAVSHRTIDDRTVKIIAGMIRGTPAATETPPAELSAVFHPIAPVVYDSLPSPVRALTDHVARHLGCPPEHLCRPGRAANPERDVLWTVIRKCAAYTNSEIGRPWEVTGAFVAKAMANAGRTDRARVDSAYRAVRRIETADERADSRPA